MGKASYLVQELYTVVKTACYTALENASDDIQSTSRDVVRQWKNKPDFGDEFTVTKERIECFIKPKGTRKVTRIFNYVDKGTKGPYLIFPKTAGGSLYFKGDYSARTSPVAKYNVGSGQSFGNWVKSKGVIHPGIEKREFMVTFMDKMIPSLQQRVQSEINKVVA